MALQRSRGVEAEVLASLALVMGIATGLLALGLLKAHSDQIRLVRDLVARGLLEDTRAPAFGFGEHSPGIKWWIVSPQSGRSRQISGSESVLADRDLELVSSLRPDQEAGIVEGGVPWQPIRFVAHVGRNVVGAQPGDVALARVPPAVSAWAIVALLLVDCGIFSLLGVFLLRRRVVQPLERLGEATRSLSDGEHAHVPVEGVGEVAELAVIFNDMSDALERRNGSLEKAVGDLRDANRQLRQARAGLERNDRLAAVGSLAAGVAHEIGNPMGAILAFLDLARRDPELSQESKGHLQRASEQGERVREILRQLLDFSRPPRAAHGAVDLRGVVSQVIGLIAAQPRYSEIEMAFECPDELELVIADTGLVSQILLNLLINAGDAVCEGALPRIEIRLEAAVLETRKADSVGADQRRVPDALACSVRDNGPGVPEEHRSRIFDPFYTTKDPGEGTGLGLANVVALLAELGGTIELVDADPDADDGWPGAQFCFRLPTVSGASRATPRARRP